MDIFLIPEDGIDIAQVWGEARLWFDHLVAQAHFGASVFWVRRLAALGGEAETVTHWQIKRSGERRGIVEIVKEAV